MSMLMVFFIIEYYLPLRESYVKSYCLKFCTIVRLIRTITGPVLSVVKVSRIVDGNGDKIDN